MFTPPPPADHWYCIRCKLYPPTTQMDTRTDPPMHLPCETTCMRKQRTSAAAVITVPTPDGTVTFTPSNAQAAAPGPTTAPAPLPGFVDEEKMQLIAENAELRAAFATIQALCAKALATKVRA